jgi:hypothetical protein
MTTGSSVPLHVRNCGCNGAVSSGSLNRLPNGTRRPLVNVEEAARMLGIGRASLYRAIQRGDAPVPVVTCNGRYWVPRRALERLIDGSDGSGTQEPPTSPASSESAAARA